MGKKNMIAHSQRRHELSKQAEQKVTIFRRTLHIPDRIMTEICKFSIAKITGV